MSELWQQLAALAAAMALYVGVAWVLPGRAARRRIAHLTQALTEAHLQLEVWEGTSIYQDLRALRAQNQTLREERAALVFRVADLEGHVDRVAEVEDA